MPVTIFLLTTVRHLVVYATQSAHMKVVTGSGVLSRVFAQQDIVAGQQLMTFPLSLSLPDYPGDPDAIAYGLATAPPHV